MVKQKLQGIFLIGAALLGICSVIYMFPQYVEALYTSVSKLINSPQIVSVIQNAVRPYLPQSSANELELKINQYRLSQELPPFITDTALCANQDKTLVTDIFARCPQCSHATLFSLSKFSTANHLMESLLHEAGAKETLDSQVITHFCVLERDENMVLFFAKKSPQVPQRNSAPTPIKARPTAAPTTFTEDELWQALSNYRHTHGKPDIERNENICVYARKRVEDHIEKMKTTTQGEYPNPEKYPLDAHAGFSADAASGYAFEVTGKNQLAENLAYWPTAKAAVHIVEWGWDSSTEGHREAQLSELWTSACITGKEGFYVAIFGR